VDEGSNIVPGGENGSMSSTAPIFGGQRVEHFLTWGIKALDKPHRDGPQKSVCKKN